MLPLVTTMPLGTTAFSALALGGARCGTKICPAYHFCSSFHNDCEDCAPICDENGHNFDKETCISECRGKTFLRLSDHAYVMFSYHAEMQF